MHKFLNSFFLLIALFFGSFAYADIDDCGIINSAEAVSGVAVDPESFEICDNDISMKVFYLMYGDVLNNEYAQTLISIFTDIPQSTIDLNKVTKFGVSISSIYVVISSLVFSLGTIIIILQTIKYIHKAQSSSQFMGENQAKKVSVLIQGLFVIFLISPVGNILMIQLLIFLMAIIAIMGANYFLGAFLSSAEINSTEFDVNDEILYQESNSFSKSLTSQRLCEIRTSKKILNNNLMEGSKWSDESPNMIAVGDNDMSDFNELALNCLQYYGYAKESTDFPDQIDSISKLRPTLQDCDEHEYIDDIEYYPSDFGSPHNCGTTTYIWPQVETFLEHNPSSSDESYYDNVINKLKTNSYKEKWDLKSFYSNYKSSYKNKIATILNSDDNQETKNRKLKEVFNEGANSITKYLENDELLNETYDSIDSFQLKSNLIYLSHISIANFLLGGNLNKGSFGDYENYLETKDNDYYGIDGLYKDIDNISNDLERVHCAYNWTELNNSRSTYLNYKKYYDNDDDLDDFIKSQNNNGVINFECLTMKTDGNEAYYDYIFEGDEKEKMFSDFKEGTNYNRIYLEGDKEKLKAAEEIIKENYAIKYAKNADLNLNVLAGYNYAVKKSIVESLSSKIKENSDFSVMIETRQKGWASLASMMLVLSKNMVNASKYSNSVLTTSTPTNSSLEKGNNLDFYNIDAFILENEDSINIRDNDLLTMNLGFIFNNMGAANLNTSSKSIGQLNEEEEEGLITRVFVWLIEDFLFSPLNYIKSGSGMDLDKSLVQNLKSCSESNDCISDDSHPLNTMMMFGHASIDKVVSLLILKMASDLLVNAVSHIQNSVDSDSKKKGGKVDQGSGFKKIIGSIFKGFPLMRILNLVLTAVSAIAFALSKILELITPILYLMLFIGIICGYLLPTMPYVFFTIVFIGWLISIFVVSVAAPIWLLRLAQLKENGSTDISFMEIWKITGIVLLKPSLLTISMIFAWTLSSVVLFFINSTMYVVLETTMTNANPIQMIISYSISYFLYVTMIYIALQHSFQMITRFSDEVCQLMGLQKIGDSELVNGLQMERLLGAAFMSQHLNKLVDGVNKQDLGKKGKTKINDIKDEIKDLKSSNKNQAPLGGQKN